MSVVKFIELSGRSSESFEDAVRQTVERASRTIRNIQSVWVKEFEGVVENNQVTQFQVVVKLSFLVGEAEAQAIPSPFAQGLLLGFLYALRRRTVTEPPLAVP